MAAPFFMGGSVFCAHENFTSSLGIADLYREIAKSLATPGPNRATVEMNKVRLRVDADTARADLFASALDQIDINAFHPEVSSHPFDMIGFFGDASAAFPQHIVGALRAITGNHREGTVKTDQTLGR